MRDRFLMRPSIARMTLDLDYGDTEMGSGRKSDGAKSVEALQTRLQELLVFEIRQDGDTQIKSLSVRALYKYVIKAIKVSAEKRRPTRTNSDSLLRRIHEAVPVPAETHATVPDKNNDANLQGSGDGDNHDASISTDTDTDNDKISNLMGALQTRAATTRPSHATSTTSRVSFGGPSGPLITEHPPPQPKIHGSPTTHSTTTGGEHPGHSGPITYRERLGGFLHPRDMRRLVTPFSASNEPELIVRRHVMLLNFDPLRAVILR